MSESGNNGRQSATILLADELFEYCDSESISEEGVRQIIERNGFNTNHHHHVSDYDFFHLVCMNENVTEGIIQCLLEYFPDATGDTDEDGRSPLHFACLNPNVTNNIIQLLVDADTDSVHREDNKGRMPLHNLCSSSNEKVDEAEATALKILKLLIEKYPEAARRADVQGKMPIHLASRGRSPEFCRVLIETYPGSERIAGDMDLLPLHFACLKGSLATVEYLLSIFPDAINHPFNGLYPIHLAIAGLKARANPAAAVEVVKFLLDCDPNQKLKVYRGKSLFHFACELECNDSNIGARIKVVKALFDAHPEAIEDNRIATEIQLHQQVQAFVNGEIVYARQAKDHRLMMTPDENGQLPLHRALHNNVRLGSIKLLVKGGPLALQSGDNTGALPLHVACEHHDSTSVVEFLVELDKTSLNALDGDGNTTLHYACRGAKYDTIALLLEKYGAASVSKRNVHGKLPIDMLWESNEVGDRESVEYMGSVFQLLKAYPEIVMNFDKGAIQKNQDGTGKKKRKFGDAELAAIDEAAHGGRAEDGEFRNSKSKRRRTWWWDLWSCYHI